MKARAILMSVPMVRALLSGTKTQTRRTIKPQPVPVHDGSILGAVMASQLANVPSLCPYGQYGDLLWVRETWASEDHESLLGEDPDTEVVDTQLYRWTHYRATPHKGFRVLPDRVPVTHLHESQPDCASTIKTWRPSIFMPRWASRLTLRITELRVQRLQIISERDALAEGITKIGRRWEAEGICATPVSAVDAYAHLWQFINGAGSWQANPFVWALTFEVLQKNVDEVLAK